MNYASLRRRVVGLSWVKASLLWGAVLTVLWMQWRVDSLDARIVRDTIVYILAPGMLALAYGEHLGWRVDGEALRNTVLLALFVLPFYLVGSSLPTIRAYYPMWETSLALGEFVPHLAKQFILVIGVETYYRGLLCVGVRKIGFKSVFISPVVYGFHHIHKPPIELLLSSPTDVLFGAVDYKSNSLLPSVVAHGAGLALLDWLVLRPPLFEPQQVVDWLSWLPIPL